MRTQEKITFDQIKNLEAQFNQGIENFDIKNYPFLQKLILDIQEEIELIFLISEERYNLRLSNREILNKKIREENKLGPKKAILNYISNNPEEFLKKFDKVGVKLDDKGDLHTGKFKKGTYIKGFIQPQFKPKLIITSDYYLEIKESLQHKVQLFITQLKETLETEKSKVENFYQSYDNLSQLFLKLGIQPQLRNYDLFSKGTGIPKPKSDKEKTPEIIKEAPDFKKIGYILKYLKDNKIIFQPRHILKYPDGSLCIYLQSKNISILISDEITGGHCFRDATYIVKGPILENEPITKEMIGEYDGKRIMFSEHRGNRVEEILGQNPDSREKIKTQNGIHEEEITKELITDKAEFIKIIKANFDINSLDGITYSKFVNKYNADPKNLFLLRSSLASNYVILGLPRNPGVNAIKNTLRGISSKSEKNNKLNFIGNPTIKDQLIKLRNYSDFDSQKHLGSTSFLYRLLNLSKIAFDNQDSDFIKSILAEEKKEKLMALTGINLPLTGQTLSVRLGGTSNCTKEYQTPLRNRFCLYIDGKENTKEYTNLCLEIQEMEKESLDSSVLHSKSIKKPEDFIQAANDNIATLLSAPRPSKISKKINKPELTIDNLKKFNVYKGIIKSIIGNKVHVNVGSTVGRLISLDETTKVGDQIDVIFLETKESIKEGKKYPLFRVNKYEGNEKVLKFIEGKTFDPDSLSVGSNYTGIVNNITESKVRVSLSKHCSGFLYAHDIPNINDLKVGKTLKVNFVKMNGEIPMFKFSSKNK